MRRMLDAWDFLPAGSTLPKDCMNALIGMMVTHDEPHCTHHFCGNNPAERPEGFWREVNLGNPDATDWISAWVLTRLTVRRISGQDAEFHVWLKTTVSFQTVFLEDTLQLMECHRFRTMTFPMCTWPQSVTRWLRNSNT